jgi:hypothetical protein
MPWEPCRLGGARGRAATWVWAACCAVLISTALSSNHSHADGSDGMDRSGLSAKDSGGCMGRVRDVIALVLTHPTPGTHARLPW